MATVSKQVASQQVVRQGFLWCMASIYLFAFTSLYVQIPGLYGHEGILPAGYILHDLSTCGDKSPLCVKWAASGECLRNYRWMIENCMKSCNSCHTLDTSFSTLFKKTPTLLWVTPYLGLNTATGMEFLCVIGIAVSLILLLSQRCRDCLGYLTLWFLYYSMLSVGQIFIRYQWDALLWESGFLAFLVAPWNIAFVPWQFGKYTFVKLRRFRNVARHHDNVMLWLIKWLLFRLMFASGVVKLTHMDPTWWDLSALNWHYESQCIPTPAAWYFQKLPTWFHRFSVVMTYVIEIGVPFLAFAPVRILRVFVYCNEVFLQLLILLTGNYNFFNLLTIVLCVSLLDDKCILSRIQCLLCRRYICSCCKKTQQSSDSESRSTKDKQNSEISEEKFQLLEKGKAAEESTNDKKSTLRPDKAYYAPERKNSEETSTASQLIEHVLDWMNNRRENSKCTQAKEFLHSEIFGRIKLACISLSCLVVLITLISCTIKWFDIKATKKETIHCETAFTPEQLVIAVQLATQFAIWMGLLSLLIEILGAFIRCLLEQCNRRSKLWQLFQCIFFSVVAMVMFAISLYSLTAVDRVVQRSLPKIIVNLYNKTSYLELTNAYGLFRSMTGVGGRPELLVIGSNSLEGPWEQYNFLYKPGNPYQPPPFVAPHQPRLDWKMWFAALQSYNENPWFLSFLHKLLLGKQDVLQLMGKGPFDQSPPKFIRAQLFLYHYTQNSSSLWQVFLHSSTDKAWWTREFTKEYLPFVVSNSSLSTLEAMLETYGVYRPKFAPEVTWGVLHPLIRDLRKIHRHLAPTTLINVLLSIVVTCLVFKAWWRKTRNKVCSSSSNNIRNKNEPPEKTTGRKAHTIAESQLQNDLSTAEKRNAWAGFVVQFREAFIKMQKRINPWCSLLLSKLQEVVSRCKTMWKIRMPSVKKKA